MALEKVTVVDKIEALESGVVQVRTATRIVEDGVTISTNYHRHTVAPGQDYSGEDAKVRGICSVLHTPEVIVTYASAQAQ